MPKNNTPNYCPSFSRPLNQLEQHVVDKQINIEPWFHQQWQQTPPPFYTSVDLRNAGFKIAPVDTNLFPAGFNNLNPKKVSLYAQAARATITEINPNVTRLLLIPESHSRNLYYFESLKTLSEILVKAGFEVRIGSLDESITSPQEKILPSGRSLILEPVERRGHTIGVPGFFPCVIILNNDLSGSIPAKLQHLEQCLMPAAELGWSSRLKSGHFQTYAQVATEFAHFIDIDPWLINPLFDQCSGVDFIKRKQKECLVKAATQILNQVKQKYAAYKIEEKPFFVVKADAGSYGMAVLSLEDPEALYELNRKQRTQMSTSKGGAPVDKAMVQEGVFTFETVGPDRAVAEPVIYAFGEHVIGGFYRIHKGRSRNENLNAPGMNFVPLCFEIHNHAPSAQQDHAKNRFYVYGVIARLAVLAAARELAPFGASL